MGHGLHHLARCHLGVVEHLGDGVDGARGDSRGFEVVEPLAGAALLHGGGDDRFEFGVKGRSFGPGIEARVIDEVGEAEDAAEECPLVFLAEAERYHDITVGCGERLEWRRARDAGCQVARAAGR